MPSLLCHVVIWKLRRLKDKALSARKVANFIRRLKTRPRSLMASAAAAASKCLSRSGLKIAERKLRSINCPKLLKLQVLSETFLTWKERLQVDAWLNRNLRRLRGRPPWQIVKLYLIYFKRTNQSLVHCVLRLLSRLWRH